MLKCIKYLMLLTVISGELAAYEVSLLSLEKPNFWKSKTGSVSFECLDSKLNTDLSLHVKQNKDSLIVSDSYGGILYKEKGVIVSDYLRDGEWILLYLQRARNPGWDFHGLLLCKFTVEGVMSRGILFPSGRNTGESHECYLNGLYKFKYPIIEAQVAVYKKGDVSKAVTRYRGRIVLGEGGE